MINSLDQLKFESQVLFHDVETLLTELRYYADNIKHLGLVFQGRGAGRLTGCITSIPMLFASSGSHDALMSTPGSQLGVFSYYSMSNLLISS